MAIRVINYTVTKNGISPATMQRGGLQGEHCATTLNFNLDEDFKSELAVYSEKGGETTLYYRFEAHTSTGLKNSTVPQVLYLGGYGRFVTLEYPLENWLTRDGGNIRVYLIFSALNVDDGQTQVDLFSYPALVHLDNVPEAEYTDGENYESISLLSTSAVDAANRAEIAAEDAKGCADAADKARELTEQAKLSLESGSEFVFLGGDAQSAMDIELVVDGEISDKSENPVKNKAIAAAIDDTKTQLKDYADSNIGSAIANAKQELIDYTDNNIADAMSETKQELKNYTDNKIADLDSTNEDIADYIVEQGQAGDWTYRKWNGGVFECWGIHTKTVEAFTKAGNVWFAHWDITLPIVSTTIPIGSGSTRWYFGNWVNVAPNTDEITANQKLDNPAYSKVTVMLYQTQDEAGERQAFLNIKGTWK